MGCRWLLFRYTRIYFYYKFFSGLSSVTLLTRCFILSIKESEAKKAKYFQRIRCGIIFLRGDLWRNNDIRRWRR